MRGARIAQARLFTARVLDHLLSEAGAGWALDEGVGALFVDGELTETVTRVPGAQVYRVEPDGRGGADERPLPCRLLT